MLVLPSELFVSQLGTFVSLCSTSSSGCSFISLHALPRGLPQGFSITQPGFLICFTVPQVHCFSVVFKADDTWYFDSYDLVFSFGIKTFNSSPGGLMDIQDLEAHPGPWLLKCGARSTSSAPSVNQLAVRILWPLPQVSFLSQVN